MLFDVLKNLKRLNSAEQKKQIFWYGRTKKTLMKKMSKILSAVLIVGK